ncbi:MAG: phosphate transport system permease protein PstA [Chthonomonadaceae bacterium]
MAELTASQLERLAQRRTPTRKSRGLLLGILAYGAIGLAVAVASGVIGIVVAKGLPAIDWAFLSEPPVDGMSAGGIWPMIRGSILLLLGTLVLAPVLGIASGIWLAEYVKENRIGQAVRVLVMTLAGTPSIVFGLFGLAIFVLKMGIGFSLVAGWLTLAIMSVPVVALTTEQAIRSVPHSFAEAGVGLGLSRWQVIRKILLPGALPGILTGLVLAAGRAAGEAPPILLTAGLYYSTEKLTLSWETLKRPVANLPYHLAEGYRQGGVIPEKIIWGTCFVLMALVLLVNLVAITVRSRTRGKRQW